MAYTIKGLAKKNACTTHDADGLANQWDYWLECNSNDKQSINDFLRLRKTDRIQMLHFIQSDGYYDNLFYHILPHIYD